MDLGKKTGPLLIFGGPYSNLQALEAMRDIAQQQNIAPDNIICTGDLVAYCGQPNEVVYSVRDWGIHVLMGNCEESFASDADDCGCGFESGSQCDLLSASWFTFANKQLDSAHRDWFAQLPRHIDFEIAGLKAQVVHGSATRINQFLFASSPTSDFVEQFQHCGADIIIAGHCGIPFSKQIEGGKFWHNAGAIGLPANDGQTQTWYSLISPVQPTVGHIRCAHLPLNYDASMAHQAMLDANLDNAYADALLSGLWPSMDVLPTAEKQQRAQAIQPRIVEYP